MAALWHAEARVALWPAEARVAEASNAAASASLEDRTSLAGGRNAHRQQHQHQQLKQNIALPPTIAETERRVTISNSRNRTARYYAAIAETERRVTISNSI